MSFPEKPSALAVGSITIRIYTRVSGSEQKREGYSLDAQERRGRQYCEYQGWTDIVIYSEGGVSGKKSKRPVMTKLLNDLRPGDVVLTKDITRFHRGGVINTHLALEDIKNRQARIVFLDMNIDSSTPVGKLMIEQFASFAAYEVEQTLNRSMEGREEAALQGSYPVGKIPFGYRKTPDSKRSTGGIRIEPDPINAPLAKRVFELAATMGRQASVDQIMREHIPTPNGGRNWNTSILAQYLSTTTFKGEFNYRKRSGKPQEKWITLDVPAIITPELWAAANAAKRVQARGTPKPHLYPLSGHIKCTCGSSMTVLPVQNQHGRKYAYYRCNNALGLSSYRHWTPCDRKKNQRQEVLLEKCRIALAHALSNPDVLTALHRPATQDTTNIDAVVAGLEEQRATLIEMATKKLITFEEFGERQERIRKQISEISRVQHQQPVTLPPTTSAALAYTAMNSTMLEFNRLLTLLNAHFVYSQTNTVELVKFTVPTD